MPKKSKYRENRLVGDLIWTVVQMKCLAMYITNQKLSLDKFIIGNVQNIFIDHDLYLISHDFWHKRKMYNFDHVLLAIAYNKPDSLTQFRFNMWRIVGKNT